MCPTPDRDGDCYGTHADQQAEREHGGLRQASHLVRQAHQTRVVPGHRFLSNRLRQQGEAALQKF